MRALVLGAGGQVGTDLVRFLLGSGHAVAMADLRPAAASAAGPAMAALLDRYGATERWHTADATDAAVVASLVDRYEADTIFHLPALLSATGERDPERCWAVNMESLRGVLDLCRARSSRSIKVIFPSSIAAFGPLPGVPGGYPDGVASNEIGLLPSTLYGVTKVAGELLGAWYTHRGWADFRSVRFPGLLSAAPPGGGSTDFANEMLFAAARGETSIQTFVRADTRVPFMHMDDAVRALVELAQAPAAGLTRRAFNIAAISPSAEELAAALARRVPGFTVRWSAGGDPRQGFLDSWPRVLDDAPAREEWGWRHQFDLDRLIDDLLGAIRSADAHR
jgi:threonine 3-dehydrogenase